MRRLVLLAAASVALFATVRIGNTQQQPLPGGRREARIIIRGTPEPTPLPTPTPTPPPSNHCRITWGVSMGKLSDCECGEELKLAEDSFTPALYSPSVLFYAPPGIERTKLTGNAVEVIKGTDGTTLRQVKVADTYTDIVVISEWEYELRFYKQKDVRGKEGNLFAFSGAPFAVWKLRNPDPPATDRFQIVRIKDGVQTISEFSHDDNAGTCQLSKDNGKSLVSKQTLFNPLDPAERTDTFIEREGDEIVTKTIKVYRQFAWGEDLVKLVEDADGEAQTTIITYYEDPKEKGSLRYAREKTTIFPDGSWEVYDYSRVDGYIHQSVIRRGSKGSPDQQS